MLSNREQEIATLKIPPHSTEAEQAVLGGCFLNKEAVYEIGYLNENDFYHREHRLIFDVLIELANKNQQTDIVTVSEILENRHLLDEAGGMRALAELAENTPSASNIKAYAEIVRKRSLLRGVLSATTEINDLVYNPEGKDADEILDSASSKIYNLADEKITSNLRSAKEVTNSFLEKLDHRFNHQGEISGLRTGLNDLDRYLNGLEGGDLIIVAGRPSMGKTSLAMNIGEYSAVKDNKTVAVFSLEMPAEQLIQRSTSSLARVPFFKMKTGKIEKEEWPKITKAAGQISQSKLFIDDTGGLSAMQVRSRCRKIQRTKGLDLIIIDYLQLMTHPKADRNDLSIAETTKQLKNIAKEFNVPVILLSQLNRGLEQREDKRPRMSDLRDSGAIEQDADVIIFVYRDEVYNSDSPHKGIAEALIKKQRNGSLGTAELVFLGQYMKFENHIGEI